MSSKKKDPIPNNVAVGFGMNYFQNMGPATPKSLEHKALDSTSPIEAYQLDSIKDDDDNNPDDPIVDVQCTVTGSYFLTKSGKIYTCGILHGNVRPDISRVTITLPLSCAQIATGRHFCLARMEGGLAVCSWGAGHFGQLGLGSESAPFVEHPTVVESLLPHVVGSPVASVAAGYWHSMAVTDAGLVFAFGCNRNGQCGTKPTREPPTICNPVLVKFDNTGSSSSQRATMTSSATSTSSSSASTSSPHGSTRNKTIRIQKIVAGRSHSVALDQSGQVYCWGANQYGQCGLLTRRRGGIAAAKHVEALSKVKIVDIGAGEAHTLALTGGGRMFAWGGGFEGQLGTGSIVLMNPKPKLIGDLDFLAIEAGREWKSQQKLNQSSEAGKTAPSAIRSSSSKSMSGIPKIVSVKAKGNSSVAISNVGHVYAWGCNDVGNLGLPKPDPATLTYVDPGQPIQKTSTLRTVHTFSFDSSHNVALPQRLDSIRDLHVTSVALSPTFLWCLGTKRQGKDDPQLGRTLYDIQEAKRQQSMHMHYERVLKTVDAGSFSATTTPDASASAAAAVAVASDSTRQQQKPPRPPSPPNDKQEGNDHAQPPPAPPSDPPEIKEGSEKEEGVEGSWEDGSTSQHSRLAEAAQASTSPMTPGKKKRLFSPKKMMKAFVRRASGNSSKSDLAPNSSKESNEEAKS